MYKKEAILGIVCLLAGIALWFGVKFLSGDNNPLSNDNKFYVRYIDINGLEKSNDVTINGGVIGQVTNLFLVPSNNSWLAEITIDEKDILNQLTSESIFEIQDDGFLGSKIILLKLMPGNKIFPGDTLNGTQNGLMSQFSRQMDSFDIHKIITPLVELITKVTNLTADIDRIISTNENNFNKIVSNSENFVKSLSKNTEKIDKLILNLSTFSDDFSRMSLPEISTKLNNDLDQLSVILKKINNGTGSASKIINSDDLINDIEATLNSIKSLANDFEKNPKKYLKEIKLLRK